VIFSSMTNNIGNNGKYIGEKEGICFIAANNIFSVGIYRIANNCQG